MREAQCCCCGRNIRQATPKTIDFVITTVDFRINVSLTCLHYNAVAMSTGSGQIK